ncbi:MAG: aldehyde dehydrogenase family protein [Siculibacillus sp.]|nr:aldehyde dehydrogenase family protein [Siculibacillus sp.]
MPIDRTKFYIDGAWVAPLVSRTLEVIDPSDESVAAVISLGSAADVDRAVAAARRAFPAWAATPLAERRAALVRLEEVYRAHHDEMAEAISKEMGAPIDFARRAQAAAGIEEIQGALAALDRFRFERPLNPDGSGDRLFFEPIGVCGLITPWNWPMNQITLKVAPAVAVGCTVVLKPSEIAPLSGLLFAEMMHEAGFPPGVFNLVNGDGPTVGEAMSNHPDIDMMSFTGSTRAGIAVMRASAGTVKKVALELGGKSPNLIFADCDVEAAVKRGTLAVMGNSGQSCNAPTRMLVERPVYDRAVEIAAAIAARTEVGPASKPGRHIGPVVSEVQRDKIRNLIRIGIQEGARLVAGGPDAPEGLEKGYFIRPTVFADVSNDMTIAREEIFGPVLCIIPFDSEEEAIAIANDTPYGLSSRLETGDPERVRRIARAIRAGMVHVNGVPRAPGAPFGGYKQSGIGREGGTFGLEDFLELKSVTGWPDPA